MAALGKFFLNNDKPVYPIKLNEQFDVKFALSNHCLKLFLNNKCPTYLNMATAQT